MKILLSECFSEFNSCIEDIWKNAFIELKNFPDFLKIAHKIRLLFNMDPSFYVIDEKPEIQTSINQSINRYRSFHKLNQAIRSKLSEISKSNNPYNFDRLKRLFQDCSLIKDPLPLLKNEKIQDLDKHFHKFIWFMILKQYILIVRQNKILNLKEKKYQYKKVIELIFGEIFQNETFGLEG